MKNLTFFWRQFSLVGQLGLSLASPLLLCLFAAHWAFGRFGLGTWIYLLALFLGLGGTFATAYRLYRAMTKENGEKKERAAFNRHE